MYVPMSGDAETIAWYADKCASIKSPFDRDYYCKMAEHLKAIQGIVNPPPPPPPPAFVDVETPPADVAAGSQYEEYWKQQAAKQARRDQLVKFGLIGLVGYGAYRILRR